MNKVNLAQKFSLFSEYWQPRIIGEINDCYVKLAKLKGEFVWHHHEKEDEMFLVVRGRLVIRFREHDVTVDEGELIIIPHGVDHLPVPEEEVHVLLVERGSTLNTGNIQNEKTFADLERL